MLRFEPYPHIIISLNIFVRSLIVSNKSNGYASNWTSEPQN